MKIMITGATGLIGRALVAHWQLQHQLILVGREKTKLQSFFPKAHEMLTWNMLQQEGTSALKSVDVIVNLAGENIGGVRWTGKQKAKIHTSRVRATALIAKLCSRINVKHAPRILNASAMGVYGFQPTIELQETTIYNEDSLLPDPPRDFLAKVAHTWEAALRTAEKAGISVVKMRFGMILAKQGGALARMLPSFQYNMGAILGTGDQPISWVALPDVVRAIDFILQHPVLYGPVNIVADEVVSQKKFAKTLAKILHRHCFLYMPGWLVRQLFGEMGETLLLNGHCVQAKRLHDAGFIFEFDKLSKALTEVLEKS